MKMWSVLLIFLTFFFGNDPAPVPHYEYSYSCNGCTCHYSNKGKDISADCHGRPSLTSIPWTDFTDTELERLKTIDMKDTDFCANTIGRQHGRIAVRGVVILCGNNDVHQPAAVINHAATRKTNQEQPSVNAFDADMDLPLTDMDDDDQATPPILIVITSTTLFVIVCGFIAVIVYIHKRYSTARVIARFEPYIADLVIAAARRVLAPGDNDGPQRCSRRVQDLMRAFVSTPARPPPTAVPRRVLQTGEPSTATPPAVPPRPASSFSGDTDATLPYTGPMVGLNSSGRVTFKV